MITVLPPFVEGTHWRELSPREGRNVWRFASNRPNSLRLDLPLTETVTFHDRHGLEWARFDGPVWTVHEEYWWNGCSPKRHVPLLGWIGTPDCPGNLLASHHHDCMSQFRRCQHFPLSHKEVDVAFYDLMRLAGFPLALPYFSAVRAASKAWPNKGNGEYSILHRP